ncbi:MAG: aspartyl protease family protein [Pseudomonadota bacterium]
MRRFIAFSLAIAAIFASGASASANKTDAASVDVKIDYGGRLIVPVSLNGDGDHDFIVDTAASKTVLFQNLASRVSVTLEDAPDIAVLGLAGVRVWPPFQVGDLALAGIVLRDHIAPILPDWTDALRTPQGILGLDFFDERVIFIDPEQKRLTVYAPNDKALRKTLSNWSSARLDRIDFGFSERPLFTVDVLFARKRLKMLLDTGSDSTFINFASLDYLDVVPRVPRRSRETKLSDVHGDQVAAYILHTPNLRVGNARWEGRSVLVSDAPVFDALGYSERPLGVLGLDFLLRQRFAIDFANDRIWFDKKENDLTFGDPDPNKKN